MFLYTFSYEVMLHCWCENGGDRPSFSELRQRFDHFLSLHVQEHHPYIEIPVSGCHNWEHDCDIYFVINVKRACVHIRLVYLLLL